MEEELDPYRDILRRGFDEFRDFVNPQMAERAMLANEPIRMVRTADGAMQDADGFEIEDFHGTQALGHRNPVVAKAIVDFLASDAPSWYPSRVNPFAGRLARILCERSGYEQVYFGCSGSDTVEASIKLARAGTRRPRIISLEGAYHGCTMGSCSLMHAGPFRDPFGPHLPGAEAIAFNDCDALQHALKTHDVAAVVVEPIQGEGGVRQLSDAFVEALCELTQKHGTLLVADEVQTAIGRSGHFLFSKQWPREPDVVLIAKALGGGLMPISATLAKMDTFNQAYGKHFEAAESHNSTFSYNALSCVAAMATLDLLTDELIEHVRVQGAEFRQDLHDALHDNPLFEEVRGSGHMCGIKLRQPENPWLSFQQFGFSDLKNRATIGPLLARRLYRRGFFTFACGHDWSILRLQPRMNIERSKLNAFVTACREELAHLAELD